MNEKRQSLLIAVLVATLLIFTRNHHFADATHLPDASWAVFFLAGFLLRRRMAFAGLLLLAAAVDFAAITWGGVDDFCVSPAYAFLLPAYGVLFAAGRWYATRHRIAWRSAVPFLGSAFGAALLCELTASGGFYLFSGRFAAPTLAGFGERFITWFPGSLQAFGFWLAVAAMITVALALASRPVVRVPR